VKKFNYILIVLGFLISVATSIYAARPWGDNYAYQEISGYFSLLLWELWIGVPFYVLYLLNKKYRSSSAHLKLLLFTCLVGSIFGAYIYVDSIVFSTSSTSALIFIFLPVYQLIFLAVIGLICLVMRTSLNKSFNTDGADNAPPG